MMNQMPEMREAPMAMEEQQMMPPPQQQMGMPQ
jgi:hypothetical protein